MMPVLTRSTARALLTKRVTIGIDKLPEDVLLEIFDAYRQFYESQPDYEILWNRDGWFKLAHVCPIWRRVVLSSSSRLHVHLLFTRRRSKRAAMLRHLPPFPILVDYIAGSCREKEEIVAIEHRSRVRGITLRPFADMAKFLRALSHPFPELENLKICSTPLHHRDSMVTSLHRDSLVLPATFLSGSTPRLRRLTLEGVGQSSLYPLLLSTTGLVELSLTLYDFPTHAWLLPILQRMSCLRRLELDLKYGTDADPSTPASSGDVVTQSKLMHLIYRGYVIYLQELVVGLVAPSLQRLDAEFCGRSLRGSFPIPHLCKFIRGSECQFTAVRLGLNTSFNSTLRFCAGTTSQSVDDLPFRLIIPGPVSLEQMGQELSGPLSTVEELIIAWDVEPWSTRYRLTGDQWRGFLYHVPQVKVVRVPAMAAVDVAGAFQQGDQPIMDLLPAMRRVEVLSTVGRDELYKSVCDTFEPLIAARQLAGRPIALSWKIWKRDGFPQ